MSAQQVTVQIMGQEYTLACPSEAQEAFHQAVSKVDVAMCRIRDAGKIKTRDRIAVLAALNIAFEHLTTAHPPSDSNPVPAANTETTENADKSGAFTEAQSQALQHLVTRLDAALSEDGKLF